MKRDIVKYPHKADIFPDVGNTGLLTFMKQGPSHGRPGVLLRRYLR